MAKQFGTIKVGREFTHEGTTYIKMNDSYDEQNAMSMKGQRIKFQAMDWVEV